MLIGHTTKGAADHDWLLLNGLDGNSRLLIADGQNNDAATVITKLGIRRHKGIAAMADESACRNPYKIAPV
jgi:hypothetical protein